MFHLISISYLGGGNSICFYFQPVNWGRFLFYFRLIFLKGVGSTTNQLFSWFWGPRVGGETSNMFFMFTPILWKMKPCWLPHIFQVGCSCSCRTLKLLVDRKWFGAGVFKKKETALRNLEKWWWAEKWDFQGIWKGKCQMFLGETWDILRSKIAFLRKNQGVEVPPSHTRVVRLTSKMGWLLWLL